MKIRVMILVLLGLVGLQGCAFSTVDGDGFVYNDYSFDGEGYIDMEAIDLSGLASNPQIPVRITGRLCNNSGPPLALGTTTSSNVRSGYGGYEFSFLIDATRVPGIYVSRGGCVKFRMEQNVPGVGWRGIATFDASASRCYTDAKRIYPNITNEEAVEYCRRDSDWLLYNFWYPFG